MAALGTLFVAYLLYLCIDLCSSFCLAFRLFRHLKPDIQTPEIEVEEFQRHFAELFNGNGKPAIGLGDMEWADT